jgi:DNA-binding transcriptional regulator LsrR (DeoR family)
MAITGDQERLLYKIAKAYYEDGFTQGQIGKRFGMSRIKVSRLLQQARQEKLVQITVISPEDSNADLERELECTYGLDEAVVISPSSAEKPVVTAELGPAAVGCLLRCLQGDEVLSVSWGSTLLSVVDALPVKHWPDMTVVQVMGGLGRPEAEVHGDRSQQNGT